MSSNLEQLKNFQKINVIFLISLNIQEIIIKQVMGQTGFAVRLGSMDTVVISRYRNRGDNIFFIN